MSDKPSSPPVLNKDSITRVLSLLNSNQYNDAIDAWERYQTQVKPVFDLENPFIAWMLDNNNLHQITQSLTVQQIDKDFPFFACLLGFILLTRDVELGTSLLQESVFIKHYELAQQAFHDFITGNNESSLLALKELPYRSAFRDFRKILKTAIDLKLTPDSAIAQLEKIPADSPYYTMAQLLELFPLTGSQLVAKLLTFSSEQIDLISRLFGFSDQQRQLLHALRYQTAQDMTESYKFDLALQFRDLFGEDLVQKYCRSALTKYPIGLDDFSTVFDKFDEFDLHRLQALALERDHQDSEFHWRQCIKILSRQRHCALKIAMILRHLAELQSTPKAVKLLIESLDYDSAHKASHLQLLDYFSHSEIHKAEYLKWLEISMQRFPDDIEILTLALQLYKREKKYTEVISLADRIIAIDPINQFAEDALVISHLVRARNFLSLKNCHEAKQELIRAQVRKSNKLKTLQIQLVHAFMNHSCQDKTEALKKIRNTLTLMHSNPVTMHFQAAIESHLVNIPPGPVLKTLPTLKTGSFSPDDFNHLTHLITHYASIVENTEILTKSIALIKRELKHNLEQIDCSNALFLAYFQAIKSIQHFELMRHCAKIAGSKYPSPIWTFYKVYAASNGQPKTCSANQIAFLDEALNQAKRANDANLVNLIQSYLNQCDLIRPNNDLHSFSEPKDEPRPIDAPDTLENLFAHVSDEAFELMDKKAAQLMKKTTPEQLAVELQSYHDNPKKMLRSMMQDSQLFSSLLLVKAAELMKIEIDVTYADVFDAFKKDKKPGFSFPFSFPF